MKLFRVVLALQDIGRAEGELPNFEFRITEIEAKETPKSYVWDRMRLNKDKLHQIEDSMDTVEMVSYKAVTNEEKLEETKERLKETLLHNILHKESQIQRLKSGLSQEPTVRIREGT